MILESMHIMLFGLVGIVILDAMYGVAQFGINLGLLLIVYIGLNIVLSVWLVVYYMVKERKERKVSE